MTIALDTTGLMARYLDGPHLELARAALAADPDWCVSALVLPEARTLIDRLGDRSDRTAELHAALQRDWDRMHVVPVDQRCLDRSSELARSQPITLINALHLAAADRLPRPLRYLTFDPGQIPVAQALGFDVISTMA